MPVENQVANAANAIAAARSLREANRRLRPERPDGLAPASSQVYSEFIDENIPPTAGEVTGSEVADTET